MRAKEFSQPKKDLVIFDIDDTLLHTTAKIRVIKDGRPVRELTNQEFNNYELQPGEEFDFGEFRDAEKFNKESQPIKPMIHKLKTILAHSPNSEVIMLTARADFDDRDKFLKTFTNLGIDMSRVHVHRAGNLPGDAIPAEKKAVYVRNYAKTGRYAHIRLYDDSRSNLSVFKSLKSEFPDIDFRAYYVGPTGGTTIHESITPAQRKDFVEMFKKFLPVAMEYLKLTSLPKMEFQASINDLEQPTFGMYVNDEKTLHVALMNRHPNDILRTIAHELCHYKQDTEHELDGDSGTTGSPQENQAHAMAGIVMRHFNKKYPEYLSSEPITESAVTDLEKDLKNPTSYDAIDHMMKAIAKNYNMTPKELHDKFVEKHNEIPDDWIKENFADGKNPGRKGLAKRSGVNTKASVSSLRKTAKHSTGEKARMAHWLANMKAGRAKAKKK
jgi:FMN phosphatase YigB (HAD superfamily)